MASFIRIGDRFVNLDNMTEARPAPPRMFGGDAGTEATPIFRCFFSDTDCAEFTGFEAGAVASYLTGQAVDVVDYYQAVLKEREQAAQCKAAFDANLALLQHCASSTGHAWYMNDDEGWDCVSCRAHCGLGRLEEVINCWGGLFWASVEAAS